jgi:DNA-binding MarR family transcriptional regulator
VEIEDATRLRRAVTHLARRFNAAADAVGLTPMQASVLGLVVGRGPIGVGALAQIEHMHPSVLSRVLSRLDELALISRTPDPNDLRAAIVTATPLGRATNMQVIEQRSRAVVTGAALLTPAEVSALHEALPALERLAENVELT